MNAEGFPTIDHGGYPKGYDPTYEQSRNGNVSTLRTLRRSVNDSYVVPLVVAQEASVSDQVLYSGVDGVRVENVTFSTGRYTVPKQELTLLYDFIRNPQANQTPLQIENTGGPVLLYFMILEHAGLGVDETNFEQLFVPPGTNKAFVNFTVPEDGVYRISTRVRMIEQAAIELSILVDNTFVKTETIHEPTPDAGDPYLGTLDSRTDVSHDAVLTKGQLVRIAAEYVQNDTVSANAGIETAVLRIVQLASKN
uniref:Uncharacterized protein n=1 Tax=Clandestinovirus TaxID=2831644 RepID=A0A8F8PN89_9VIRU|nr:hypothetical protein KOM_12_323 [Clandestinovirus]